MQLRIRAVVSAAGELRLNAARAFVRSHLGAGGGTGLLLVGASRSAADDLARSVASGRGATLGIHRFSLTQLAARLAAPRLAFDRVAPTSPLGAEAVAARAAFEAGRDGALSYFLPVARTPGFPRALARTLQELRLAGVGRDGLAALPLGGADLAGLLERFEAQFGAASATDRAALFTTATDALGDRTPGVAVDGPLVLLDVPMESAAEFSFVRALVALSPAVCITVPFGDRQALGRLRTIDVHPEVLEQHDGTDLSALRRHLFTDSQPQEREPTGEVRFFSAPGEARECVEIARRILAEARRGVRFDEIAVLLRSPERYASLLQHAFARVERNPDGSFERDGGIPLWFDRGTRRPHAAGRAFLAILDCARDQLSARRFAEYLSLGQVPSLDAAPAPRGLILPDDEMATSAAAAEYLERTEEADTAATLPNDRTEGDSPDGERAVVDGTLRAPWKWESLIVESSVIGGDPKRWQRRLDGLAREFRLRLQAEMKEDPDSPRGAGIERDLRNLGHLRRFALPIVDRLASWPKTATWGEWLDRFSAIAPTVLRRPDRVLRTLAELRPMSEIGPVALAEARDVLAERLHALEDDPPRHRYGRVFAGSPQQARGRTFKVVFVPALAERMFPQKPHEDPMLLDKEMRVPLASGLAVQEDRGRAERLLLHLAAGAATERLWLSYPRIEIVETRPRVPSFYALDVIRAVTGRIPNHEALQAGAAGEAGAGLAWPAPADAADAIDDLEHDLAVLHQLLQHDRPDQVRGHANYLLRLNEPLKRSVTARWARARSQWTAFDGVTRITAMTAPILAGERLTARPYSLSALQKFASCPYQFLLSAILRLEPAERPEPLQKLDPLTRGALFHEVQARFFRTLQRDGRLPVTPASVAAALAVLDATIADVAATYHDELAPAIERVWRDEIADLAKDLRVWAAKLADAGDWVPEYFEYSFGLSDDGRDPRSRPDPVQLDGRFLLRGSVDLVERKRGAPLLRVTDHKTGKNRTTWKTVIGGGGTLQPVLYSLAVEQALALSVGSGRLFFCTAAGGFTDHEIPITDGNRRAGVEALEIVDRALELGFLPAAPAPRACTWCNFRPVCGPHEERRVAGKPRDKLGDLDALREMA